MGPGFGRGAAGTNHRGIGTVFGPLLGALVVKTLGEITKLMTGGAPGLDLVIYGGVSGCGNRLRAARNRRPFRPAPAFSAGRPSPATIAGATAWLNHCSGLNKWSKRFGGLLAVDRASLTAGNCPHHGVDRAEWCRQDHLVLDHHRLPAASGGRVVYDGRDILGEPPHRSPAAASRAHFRSCSRSQALRCARTSRSARICRDPYAPMLWPPPAMSHALSGLGNCSITRHPGSRSPAASGSNSPRSLHRTAAPPSRRGARGSQPIRNPDMVPVIPRHLRSGITIVMIEQRHASRDEFG